MPVRVGGYEAREGFHSRVYKCSKLGWPWGNHKKTTERIEQELCEFVRLKHHTHGLKNQHLG
jgi:hypothetical protein